MFEIIKLSKDCFRVVPEDYAPGIWAGTEGAWCHFYDNRGFLVTKLKIKEVNLIYQVIILDLSGHGGRGLEDIENGYKVDIVFPNFLKPTKEDVRQMIKYELDAYHPINLNNHEEVARVISENLMELLNYE
jgi:hypothetical protein